MPIFRTDYVKLPTQSIKWSCANKQERLLCFFSRLKRFHRSGLIRKPFSRHGEYGMHHSKRTYIRYLNSLLSLGWAHKQGDDMQLISINKLPMVQCGNEEKTKYFYLPNDKTTDFDCLRVVMLKLSERGQKAMIRKHNENKSQTVFKKCGNGDLIQSDCDLRNDINMSTRTFAAVTGNEHHTKLWRTYLRASKKKLLHLTRRYIINQNAKHSQIIEGVKMQKLSFEFETRFDAGLRRRKVLSLLSVDERIDAMYFNDLIG